MELNGKVYCNVCGANSMESSAVFVEAVFKDEKINVCTSCIPSVIHGGSDVVHTNEELKAKIEG